jgi:hypothetical protein
MLFLRRFRYGFPCVERVLNKIKAGIRFNLRSPLFCVHYPFVSLRQNGVETGFVKAGAILPKGYNLSGPQ